MENRPQISGSIVEPAGPPPFAPATPGSNPVKTGAALSSSNMRVPGARENKGGIIETLVLVIVTIIAIVFIWLFIAKFIEWEQLSTDIDGQIDAAVAMAKAETETEMEAVFLEREKSEYKTFAGPADYGSLTFQYPKTWSVYIARDAANGGDFQAYMNPGQVNPVGNDTINALRVLIRDVAFDSVVRSYEGSVKNGRLSLTTRNVGGVLANVYTGTISNNINGALAILKVRDKTVILQTDADLFIDDFYRLLDTVTVTQ